LRSLSVLALLVASVSAASANTISFLCLQAGTPIGTYINGVGSLDYSCSGFSAPAGFNITSVTILGRVDYQFGQPGSNTFQVSFTESIPGFSPSPLVVANAGGEASSGIANGTTTLAGPLASLAAFTVTGASSTTLGAVDAGSASVRVTYTYELQQQPPTGTPEPSTLALVGGVLVLAGLRKFRR
jgi:hypothetical protein